MSSDEPRRPTSSNPFNLRREDERDFLQEALCHLRGSEEGDRGTSGAPTFASLEKSLYEWADAVGLLLEDADILDQFERGGLEHDVLRCEDIIYKATKDGVFGLRPGIELDLVSDGQDGRRFHLWEATPLQYLERLSLQNQLVPGLNRLIAVTKPNEYELVVITSQILLEINPVTQAEIDEWFVAQGFEIVTRTGYYRASDNLAIFDAHDKNVVRDGDILIPFDVIPIRPDKGFLKFIQDTVAKGDTISAVRTAKYATT